MHALTHSLTGMHIPAALIAAPGLGISAQVFWFWLIVKVAWGFAVRGEDPDDLRDPSLHSNAAKAR